MTPVMTWLMIALLLGGITGLLIYIELMLCRKWKKETKPKSLGILILRIMYIGMNVICTGFGIGFTGISLLKMFSSMF